MVGTDNGCKVLRKFSSPCGATVKTETDVVHDPCNAILFCSEYSPKQLLQKRNTKSPQCFCTLMFR